jgi:glycosidase
MQKLVRAGMALALIACGGSDEAPQPPPDPGLSGGTVYEIFVRSFADSDGDGVGDLRGLTAKLDYLNDGDPETDTDLGVQGVWLMPIFPSPSYHGYDVTDYRAINPDYGTLEDFDAFVAAAHARGVKVLIDFVLNHSSTQHPWFVDATAGGGNRDFYTWSPEQPRWTRPWDASNPWYLRGDAWYYGVFCDCMPDLNLENPAVEAELVDAMKFWLARGVDGFRLDAVRYFYENGAGQQSDQPENHAFLARVRAALDAEHPDHVLVAEAWAALEIQARYRQDQAHLAFSFDLSDALKAAAASGDAAPAINILARSEAAFPGPERSFEAPFLSNHDQVRVLRALENDTGRARVAAAALFAMPGTPFLYYGEEIGMLGGPGAADENKRTAFRWNGTAPGFGFTTGTPWRSFDEPPGVDVATQQADPASLWNLYRALIALRRNQVALQAGAATRPPVTGGGPGILALLREGGGERVLLVANFGGAPSGAFTVALAGAPRLLLAEGLAAAPAASAGQLSFAGVAARGFAYVAID